MNLRIWPLWILYSSTPWKGLIFNGLVSETTLRGKEIQKKAFSEINEQDFPDDPVVKNLPANTENPGSIPGPGRPHKLQGSWARGLQLLKPACPRDRAPQREAPARRRPRKEKPPQGEAPATRSPRNEKPLQREAHVIQLESSLCLLQLEKAHVEQQRPSTTNKKYRKIVL